MISVVENNMLKVKTTTKELDTYDWVKLNNPPER